MWVKLHTKILNWEWYSDINTTRLFIHCLLKANWKDGKFEGIDIPRGSFVTSLPKLSKETGLSIQQTRTSLSKLILTNNITNKSYTKYRVISIINYEAYQENNSQSNRQITDNQQTNQQQSKNNTEYKTINTYYYLEKNFGRTIASPEIQKIDEWKKWFSDEIINHAIDLTILNGARALSYTEAIINSWHDKGYKTLEECRGESKRFKEPAGISEEQQLAIDELAEWDWLNED
nr:MAG TPA: replisome organizer [Caudoviricetes sp.]